MRPGIVLRQLYCLSMLRGRPFCRRLARIHLGIPANSLVSPALRKELASVLSLLFSEKKTVSLYRLFLLKPRKFFAPSSAVAPRCDGKSASVAKATPCCDLGLSDERTIGLTVRNPTYLPRLNLRSVVMLELFSCLTNVSRNLRFRSRRRMFCFRTRLNRDLSPFCPDIYAPFKSRY